MSYKEEKKYSEGITGFVKEVVVAVNGVGVSLFPLVILRRVLERLRRLKRKRNQPVTFLVCSFLSFRRRRRFSGGPRSLSAVDVDDETVGLCSFGLGSSVKIAKPVKGLFLFIKFIFLVLPIY
jgi:hypothetical protein